MTPIPPHGELELGVAEKVFGYPRAYFSATHDRVIYGDEALAPRWSRHFGHAWDVQAHLVTSQRPVVHVVYYRRVTELLQNQSTAEIMWPSALALLTPRVLCEAAVFACSSIQQITAVEARAVADEIDRALEVDQALAAQFRQQGSELPEGSMLLPYEVAQRWSRLLKGHK